MSFPRITVACNLDAHVLQAVLPLLEAERVQAIEWSFDALYQWKTIPSWFDELLHVFASENRLIGHGIFFSLFSGQWSPHQQNWLQHLKQLSYSFHFDHVTEHFGFMTGADFHAGAPISIPFTTNTLQIGIDRLKRIQDACQCPVGLENLAFSYSLDEVKKHGDFLEQLVSPVNGFIILDLHNLWCQIQNFDITFEEIIALYPLERVREIHISGGSWEETMVIPGKMVRRDTHDDVVPPEVFQLLKQTIPLCPNLKYVVLEQLGTALDTPDRKATYQQDFYQMEAVVQQATPPGFIPALSFLPELTGVDGPPPEDAELYRQQLDLSAILETAATCEDARERLSRSSLAHSAWQTEQWAPYMLETAIRIAQKWKR